jgi:hypothetical protein
MAADAMKAHLRDFPADGPEGRLFTAPQGRPVVYTHFMDGYWRPACAKAGIAKGTGPHALRHHNASLLIKHGESVKTVSERHGHTDAAMTLNIYTHLRPDSEERTRAAVDKAYADQSARCPTTGRRSGVAALPRADRSQHAADSARTTRAAQPAPSARVDSRQLFTSVLRTGCGLARCAETTRCPTYRRDLPRNNADDYGELTQFTEQTDVTVG